MSGTKKPVKQSTVDEMTRRGVANGMTVDQAKKTAIDSANRVNRDRAEKR